MEQHLDMYENVKDHYAGVLNEIIEAGLYKSERVIESPQEARIKVGGGREVLNMCANNYLGLSDHADIVAAAREGLDEWGFGLSSVRFICGTQTIHKQLEAKISEFLGTEDTILYTSCFDANGGLFETVLTEAGFKLLYLPRYSPDLSPIEPGWSKTKSVLRAVEARTPEALEIALAPALDSITSADARGWFNLCGYPFPN